MNTTSIQINIDDESYRQLKIEALRKEKTVRGELIPQILKEYAERLKEQDEHVTQN